MRPKLSWLLLVVLIPAVSVSQSFLTHQNASLSDQQFFMKELSKRSALLQTMYAAAEAQPGITDEEAKKLVREKLDELNDQPLRDMYSQVSAEDIVRIGFTLYVLMGTISNLPSQYSQAAQFGGGFGLYLMYSLANFVIMPELAVLFTGFGEKYSGQKFTARFVQLALSITALYLVQLETMKLVFGLSPQFGYHLSGKYKDDDGNKEDIEFGGDYGARRFQMLLGITAGVMLQNYMMLRLQYGLGLTKLYKDEDAKMSYIALILNIPFQVFSSGSK